MTEIRLDFLDRARIIRAGAEVSPRELPAKLLGLLALLAAEASRSASVERVCLLLWPDVGEALGRKSLNQVLVRSRRVVPGALERPAEHQLALSPEVESDVHGLLFGSPFRSCSDVPAHAEFELLPGFSIRGCPELNDWLDSTRARVRTRAADAALERVEGLAPAEALCWAALAYRLNRADERAAAALVRGTAAVSGPAAAWAAFTEHRRWLAEELDITPSARLTAIAAEACREAGAKSGDGVSAASAQGGVGPGNPERLAVPAVVSMAGPVGDEDAGRPPLSVRRRGRELVAGILVLAVLSAATWFKLSTGGVAATSSPAVLLRTSLGGGAADDSVVALAANHLAQHGVSAELMRDQGTIAGLRLVVPGWRGKRVVQLSLGAPAHATPQRLAAALADSALALHARSREDGTAPRYQASGAAGRFLQAAEGRLATARALIADGGPAAALVMLSRADSLAVRASRASPRDWQPYGLRAEIANLTFWHQLATGTIHPAVLRRGLSVADSAVALGGRSSALKLRAALRYSLWVHGGPGSEQAGADAERDYVAVVEASPTDGEAWSRLAQLHHARGRLGDAYSAAEQAEPHVRGPARMETLMELFLAALDRRDYSTARHWCAELGFHHDRSWLAATCAAMYAWADPHAAPHPVDPQLVEEATGLQPSMEAQLALLRAGADLARGKDSAASTNIRRALPIVDHDAEVASVWAGVLVELGMADSALVILRRYLKDTPSSRVIVSRPWFRPLYRSGETWADFIRRLSSDAPTEEAGGRAPLPLAGAPVSQPGPGPSVRVADDS